MNKLNIFRAEMFYEDHRAFCEIANEILNKYIEENGVRVYGQIAENGVSKVSWMNHNYSESDTHTAILINVQEIKKKCEHEIDTDSVKQPYAGKEIIYKCANCKETFKAEWKEVD